MTINNNSVEQINVALLDMDKKLKSAISKSASASDFNNLEASVDNIKRTLNETKTGLEPGKTYNINISGNAATADKAKEAEKANKLVNALTVNGETYDGSEAVDAGVQKIENGGTGQTTANDAANSFINSLTVGTDVPVDNDYYVCQSAGGGTITTTYHRRPISKLWEYIKGKISSVLGLTKDNYGGKASTAGTADTAANATTATKVANALTVNGETYDGSSAVDAGVQKIENGGTGVTTQADINKAFINNLEIGNSDVTDGTEFVSSWASDNGFAETTEGAVNTPYKRKFIKVWNYIKGKISSVLGLTKDNYGGTAATILDYVRGTPIKVRWGGPGIDSADWYPAFSADGSAIEPINRANIHAGTADSAGTADKVASEGASTMWIYGRAEAICKTTSAAGGGGWKTLASIKTASGSYEIGNLSGEDFIRVVYSSDTDVNAGNNNVTHLLYIRRGNIETPHEAIANSVKALSKLVVPIGEPSSLEDGCIWIER